MMTNQTEAMLDRWTDGEAHSIHDDMMELTLRIVSQALLGVNIDRYVKDIESAVNTFLPATSSLLNFILPEGIPLPSRWKMARARETLDDAVNDIIQRKHANPGENDVISMLLAARDDDDTPLSDEQIRDEAITLIIAGHKTTAVSLTYTMYLLAQHPKIEEEFVAELDSVLDGEHPIIDDPSELTYTGQIVKESMRLFPPVPGIVREPKEADQIGGYRIPAGTKVFLSQWVVHRDGRWYDDPLAFRPERWTDDMETSLPQFAYFPFAAGPRRCIGDRFAMLEAQLLLATIYQDYHLELMSNRNIEIIPTITSRPKKEIQMTIHERE